MNLVPLNELRSKVEKAIAKRQSETTPFFPFADRRNKNLPFPFFVHEGELTLLAGETGCGKSLLMAQIALHLALKGMYVAVLSLDNGPEKTCERWVHQAIFRKDHPVCTSEEIDKAFQDILKANVCTTSGILPLETIHKMVREAAEQGKGKPTVVFIDSAVYFEDVDNDESYKVAFLGLKRLARELGIHICIVHGMHGLNKEVPHNDLLDVADPDLIYNGADLFCDNIIMLVKNKDKELERNIGKPYNDAIPDHLVKLCKQEIGSEFYIPLWFDETSLSFCTTPDRIPPAL